jgi:glycosyltransferase involved in cell wall biosynthesis
LIFIGGTSEPGGLHVHTADIAQSCAALGCRVTILCTSVDYFSQMLVGDSVAVERIRPFAEMSWREWIRTWSRYAKQRADIVFCCGHQAEIRITDLVAASLIGAGVYTIVHRPFEGSWKSLVPKAVYGRLSSKVLTGVVAVSDEIATDATRDFNFPPQMVSTCVNWASPTFSMPTAAERVEARKALGISPSSIQIAYLGRLAPEKRIDALLRAFASVLTTVDISVTLDLIGDGWKKRELAELAHQLGIDDRVFFRGWTSTPQSALAACDVFVLPSIVEGFPLALIEAMATGCASLAHPMPSTRRLIENGTHGVLADLSDPRSFATALRGLIECGPAARSRMGLAAAERVASEYSRMRRLPNVLSALGVAVDFVPEFRLRALEFRVGAT